MREFQRLGVLAEHVVSPLIPAPATTFRSPSLLSTLTSPNDLLNNKLRPATQLLKGSA